MALERRIGTRCLADQSREQLASRHRRLQGENLCTFAADVQLHAQHGYPQFPTAAQEELALHSFLQGLTPERLRQHVHLAMPKTLSEALREAEWAEVVLSTWLPQQKVPMLQPHVKMTDYDGEEEVEEVCRVQPSSPQLQRQPSSSRQRPSRLTNCCY